MPTPRRCTAVVVDGFIMVLGGMRGRGHQLFLFGDPSKSSRLIAYNLRSKLLESFELGLPRTEYASVVVHRDKVYVAGGGDLRLRATSPAIRVLTIASSRGTTAE